jgi:signal peptidase I
MLGKSDSHVPSVRNDRTDPPAADPAGSGPRIAGLGGVSSPGGVASPGVPSPGGIFTHGDGHGRFGGMVVHILRGWIAPVAVAAAILFPLRSALADWYQVPTGSMRPTIIEGDRIFVSNLAFGLRIPFTSRWITRWDEPQRGDIVTFSSPADGQRLVKRVIGLPGDRISMSGDRLTINGEGVDYEVKNAHAVERLSGGFEAPALILSEELPGRAHAVTLVPGLGSRRSFPDLVSPDGYYFMMGDNRDQSFDSRFFGFVPAEKIFGRASRVVLSLNPRKYYLPRSDRVLKPLV